MFKWFDKKLKRRKYMKTLFMLIDSCDSHQKLDTCLGMIKHYEDKYGVKPDSEKLRFHIMDRRKIVSEIERLNKIVEHERNRI